MRRQPPSQLPLAGLVVVLVVGSVGFVTGVGREADPQGYRRQAEEGRGGEAAQSLAEAPTHAELASRDLGPNRGLHAEALERLRADRRGLTDEVGRPAVEEWEASIRRRTDRRAFDGAPPVVPHAISQRGFPPCLNCHAEGLVVGNHTAPAMSHEPLASCTQCHVTTESPVPGAAVAGVLPAGGAFKGIGRAGRGSRASLGAPPTVPHSTWLRERCDSCHGVLATGLRTSHACQQSCEQCHAPSAQSDQQPLTAPPGLPPATVPR